MPPETLGATAAVVLAAVTDANEAASRSLGKCAACVRDQGGERRHASDAEHHHGTTNLALCHICMVSLISWEDQGGVHDAPELWAWAYGVELDEPELDLVWLRGTDGFMRQVERGLPEVGPAAATRGSTATASAVAHRRRSPRKPVPAGSHWSPLRYPGGKRPLLPRMRAWLAARPQRPEHFVEGFAGGACMGLTALCEDRVDRLSLIELDDEVAWFWKVVFSVDGSQLAARLPPTEDAALERLDQTAVGGIDRALHTLLRNRFNYNGILLEGAGRAGASSESWRYNPTALATRIRELTARRDAVDVIHADAPTVLPAYARDGGTVFYLDPPYSAHGDKASRQYLHWKLDHGTLMDVANDLRGDFLMSHQADAPMVRTLAVKLGLEVAEVTAQFGSGVDTTELLIARDLRWLKRAGLRAAGPSQQHIAVDANLKVLSSFVTLAEELHYGRAAARLAITQPALSKRIASLETALGTRLFTRTTRTVRLSDRGRMLYDSVHAPLRALQSALSSQT